MGVFFFDFPGTFLPTSNPAGEQWCVLESPKKTSQKMLAKEKTGHLCLLASSAFQVTGSVAAEFGANLWLCPV